MTSKAKLKAISTPIVIATAAVSVLTGFLMFFNIDSGLNRLAHEWVSLGFGVAIALHLWRNWAGFLRVISTAAGKSLLVIGILIALLSFANIGQRPNEPAFIKATHAILDAPLNQTLPVFNLNQSTFKKILASNGFDLANQDTSLRDVALRNKVHPFQLIDMLFEPQ